MKAAPVLAVGGALRDVLGNSAIRKIEIAWTAGTAADWAFLVILLVVAYDAGGALAVGVLGAVRVLPAIVIPPFASTLVQRFRGDRMLTAINLVRTAGVVLTAIVIGADLPLATTYVLAAVVAGAGSLVRADSERSPAGARAHPRRARRGERRVEHRRGPGDIRRAADRGRARRLDRVGGREPARGGLVRRGCSSGHGTSLRTRRGCPGRRRRRPERALPPGRCLSSPAPVPGRGPPHGRLRRPDLRARPAHHADRRRVHRAPRHGRHRGRPAERGDRPGRSRRCDSVRSGSSASGD